MLVQQWLAPSALHFCSLFFILEVPSDHHTVLHQQLAPRGVVGREVAQFWYICQLHLLAWQGHTTQEHIVSLSERIATYCECAAPNTRSNGSPIQNGLKTLHFNQNALMLFREKMT